MTTEATLDYQAWQRARELHPDAVILVRTGRFTRAFGHDISTIHCVCNTSQAIQTTWAKRGLRIGRLAVPAQHTDRWVEQLEQAGFAVAVVEHVPQQSQGAV